MVIQDIKFLYTILSIMRVTIDMIRNRLISNNLITLVTKQFPPIDRPYYLITVVYKVIRFYEFFALVWVTKVIRFTLS